MEHVEMFQENAQDKLSMGKCPKLNANTEMHKIKLMPIRNGSGRNVLVNVSVLKLSMELQNTNCHSCLSDYMPDRI